jgi:hypothetical protein
MTTQPDAKLKAILAHLTRFSRVKPPLTLAQISARARAIRDAARAKAAPVTAPAAQKTQVEQIADGVMLAREVQIELARRLAPTAAVARTAPTKRADEPAAPVIVQPVPTVEKPLAPVYLYPVRSNAPIEMTAKELLAKYNSLHGAEGLEFFRLHEREILAARAGRKLDAGEFPKLSGQERVEAAIRKHHPQKP